MSEDDGMTDAERETRLAGVGLRYADMPWGCELDEAFVTGTASFEHGGDHVTIWFQSEDGKQGVLFNVWLRRLPVSLWWDEIVDAWRERRLPCLWMPTIRIMDHWPADGDA